MTDNISIFLDTKHRCENEPILQRAIKESKAYTKLYKEGVPIKFQRRSFSTRILVTRHKSFEAAALLKREHKEDKVLVHNFASATNPGGGVEHGANAQEECLCRVSTLYFCLNEDSLWKDFYLYHRNLHSNIYTERAFLTPNVKIIKSDDYPPCSYKESDYIDVDVITMAAPNLRGYTQLSEKELYDVHLLRAKTLLSIAAANNEDHLVLGAFGCGAFHNDPKIVAKAYKDAIKEFDGLFKTIEFAVYCSPRNTINYDAFRRVLSSN